MYFSLIKKMYLTYKNSINNTQKIISNGLLLGLIGTIPGSFGPSSIIPIIPFWIFMGVSLSYTNYMSKMNE